MSEHLYQMILTRDLLGDEAEKLKELKCFINEDKNIDNKIKDQFPINYFGEPNELLRVKGSKGFLKRYEKLYDKKIDFIEKFENIKFEGINDKKNIILSFPKQDIIAYGMYNFFSDFLSPFQLTKFVNFCIEKGYDDLISHNIEQILARQRNTEKQFRLLKDESENWGIRGMTSDRYNNYDNNIVIYLSLLSLHKFSKEKNKYYSVDFAYISDSYLYIFFEQESPLNIVGVGSVYLGLSVSNGEIRNNKFKVELRYRIEANEGQKSFAAIFSNPVFDIIHNMNVSTIELQLERLSKLEEYEDSVLQFIGSIYSTDILTEDAMYFMISALLEKVDDCSDISKKTKNEFKKMETNVLIANTISLIDFFGKLNTIPTDINERIFIERIFHKVISDLLKNKKENYQKESI